MRTRVFLALMVIVPRIGVAQTAAESRIREVTALVADWRPDLAREYVVRAYEPAFRDAFPMAVQIFDGGWVGHTGGGPGTADFFAFHPETRGVVVVMGNQNGQSGAVFRQARRHAGKATPVTRGPPSTSFTWAAGNLTDGGRR
jgi:CubicO group peptidase (beta-lactamase class C family)